MEKTTPKWTTRMQYMPDQVQHTFVLGENDTLIGTIIRVEMINQVTKPVRLLYIADVHNFESKEKGYDPVTLGVYDDPIHATMDIVGKYEEHSQS